MTAMLTSQAGMELVHVPYKSEPPAITDLLSGTIQVMISSYATVAPHMREGKPRPLVTTLPNRTSLMPEVPSIVEVGFPKFSVSPWAGMFGPARMPKEVTERLNREFNALIKRADVREALLKQAFDPKGSSVDEFNAYVKDQYDIWGRAIRDAGIQPE
jgi:tripartite-type tricarboxylate transporter receptor subunit TctC